MNLGELPAFGTPFRHTNVPYYDWRLVVYFVPILSQLDPVYTPHLTSSRSILILSSHLRLGLPSGLFPSGFRTKPLYTPPPPSHSSRFYHPKNIGWGVQIIQLLLMQLPPLPCYLVPPRPKYSPQHPILKHPQPTFLPQCQRPSFTPIKNDRQNYSSSLNFWIANWKTEDSALNDKHSLTSICS